MGIFSLVPRVTPPVTSQLTTVFLIHFIWFTNWSSQTFCKKWVEWIRHELLNYKLNASKSMIKDFSIPSSGLNETSFEGVYFLTSRKLPSLFLSLSLSPLYGLWKPSSWNWPIGKDLPSFVSDITSKDTLKFYFW